MKKQGFTLIELLAVIVIMGILMFAAIPAINRTIENARKDQYINTAQNYARAVETLWNTDGLECKSGAGTSYQVSSSLTNSNTYYVFFATGDLDSYYSAATNVPLLQQGGKSPWGNKDLVGFVMVEEANTSIMGFYVQLYDGTHYLTDDGLSFPYSDIDRSLISTQTWDIDDLDGTMLNINFDWYGCRLV